MKQCTIVIKCGDDVNQNDFKSWLKTIPPEVSKPGDQTITWENIPEPKEEDPTNGKAKKSKK